MALLTGGLYVALLAVRPALEAVDPGGGRAHVEHGRAGAAAEMLGVPSLIQRADTFLNQDDGCLYVDSKLSYVQDETATSCTARNEPFLVVNFTKKKFIFLENLENTIDFNHPLC